ncbi:hypothetical protein D3C77_313250 [compost metagenome]
MLLLPVRRQRRSQRQRRRRATDRRRTAREHAEQPIEAHGLGNHHRHTNGHHHNDDHQRHRLPAKAGNLLQGNTHAQQRHTDAQHRARGKFNPGLAAAVSREKVQRHAQQQGKQHHRRIVMLTEKTRRTRRDQAHDKTWRKCSHPVVNGGNCHAAHWPDSSDSITINSCSPCHSTG